MSLVSLVLDIPKDKLMILVREGALFIYKHGIQSASYFNVYNDMFNQEEVESLWQFNNNKDIDIQAENQKIVEDKAKKVP